jgi:death-on-curing protein
MTFYLELRHLLAMQEVLVRKYGGTLGIRDRGLFESAIAQPQQSAFGEDLFKTIPEKAAAYCYYLCQNHPFLDGNKRIAAAAAITFLRMNGHDLPVTEVDLYKTVMKIAKGKLSREKLAGWFQEKSVKRKKTK